MGSSIPDDWKLRGQAGGGSTSPLEKYATFLRTLIEGQPDLTLDEVVWATRKRKLPGSRTAVWRFFQRHSDSRVPSLPAKLPIISGMQAMREIDRNCSNLGVALSGGGIFAFFCSERDHKPQNSGGVIPRRVFTRPGSISDVLSVRRPFPLCPRFRTYCCLAATDVQGQIGDIMPCPGSRASRPQMHRCRSGQRRHRRHHPRGRRPAGFSPRPRQWAGSLDIQTACPDVEVERRFCRSRHRFQPAASPPGSVRAAKSPPSSDSPSDVVNRVELHGAVNFQPRLFGVRHGGNGFQVGCNDRRGFYERGREG